MLVDTSAWVEYFKGSDKGSRVASLLQQDHAVYTCPLTVAEISLWCQRNNHDPLPFVKKLNTLSTILHLSEDILITSGKIYYEERKRNGKIGLIDCIIYTTAVFHGLVLLTADRDFRTLPKVEFL